MAKPPSFQWYPKDCDTDENVRGMDDREFGFYMRCLNHSWLNNGLPGDLIELGRVMGKSQNYLEKIWNRVGKCFELRGGRFFNSTQEKQRNSVREYVESKRSAANSRWDASKTRCTNDAHASPAQCSPSASPSASPVQQPLTPSSAKTAEERLTSPRGDVVVLQPTAAGSRGWFDAQHDRWYHKAFWNRKNRPSSRKAYEKRVRILVSVNKLSFEDAAEFLFNAAIMDRQRFEPTSDWGYRSKFHPATWLNGALWEDEANKDPPKGNGKNTCTAEELAESIENFGRTRV